MTGPQDRRRLPTGEREAVVRRPDGALQIGVGPGAVVVRDPVDGRTARTLGTTLLTGPATAPPRCPVLGHGPVAARLGRALGQADESPAAPLRVVVHQHVIPPEVGVAAARDGGPCLPVVVQSRRVVVGPVTGRPEDPCLHCLDLHRRDRDPSWPEVATWFGHPTSQLDPVHVSPEVLVAVEGLVLLLVASVLAGRPVTPGLAHEVGPVAPHVVARTWRRHPVCPWHPGGAGPA